MATYKLTQTFSDNTTKDISFTIPDEEGAYKLKFTLSDSTVIDAGNVTVGTTENTYKLSVGLTDGTTQTANIVIPALGYTVTIPKMSSAFSKITYGYNSPSGSTAFISASSSQTQTALVQKGGTI